MRNQKWTMVALLVFVSQAAGQTARKFGSVEAQDFINGQKERAAAQAALYKKHLEMGSDLFGVSKHWSLKAEDTANGTLITKYVTEFKIDDWGCTDVAFKVISKVNEKECLVQPQFPDAKTMLIRGLDMKKVTDDVEFVLQHPIVIQDTYSYKAVSSSKRTVLVLNCDETKFKEVFEKKGPVIKKERDQLIADNAKRVEQAKQKAHDHSVEEAKAKIADLKEQISKNEELLSKARNRKPYFDIDKKLKEQLKTEEKGLAELLKKYANEKK